MKNVNELILEEIQAEYRRRYKIRTGAIVFDGIVNCEKYSNILFLLKEANQEKATVEEAKPINVSLNETIPWEMWKRVAEWVHGLSNTKSDCVPFYSKLSDNQKHDEIKKIAVININKADGTGSPVQADIEKRLMAAVNNNSDLLMREIELVEPRIIICGGTYWYLQEAISKYYNITIPRCDGYKSFVRASFGSLQDVLIVDFCHPAVRSSSLMTYYGITNIYRQALTEGWNR